MFTGSFRYISFLRVDSFGHNAMLPQLIKLGGMDSYVMMRPFKTENPDIPDNAFNWESPDGSHVTVFRINNFTMLRARKHWTENFR